MIRDLTVEDVPAIIALGTTMAEETGHLLHVERSNFILREIIPSANVFAQGRVEDGRCSAMFIGEVAEHPLINLVFAQEICIYTHPDCRGGTTAARLIKSFTSWAREKNVDYIKVEVTAGVDDERATRLFEKFGYDRVGFLAVQGVRREAWQQQL
tara:strand:- start:47 stop:511 length:465 start_codon:yes stop_codon:yes gene_type:complete